MCSFIEFKSMNSGCIMLGVWSAARISRHSSCLQEAYNLTTLIYLYLPTYIYISLSSIYLYITRRNSKDCLKSVLSCQLRLSFFKCIIEFGICYDVF